MDAVMGYAEQRRYAGPTLPVYPEPCPVPPYRYTEPTAVRAVHTSHYSPYKARVSDKHRHKRTYTSMGIANDSVNRTQGTGEHYQQQPPQQNTIEGNGTGQGSMEDVSKVGMMMVAMPSASMVEEGQMRVRRCKSAPCTPLRPFQDENRTDEYYRRYLQLSGNVAYRYPEPGYPRERQGAMGGTWRHVKEVLGYGGSQVCFVDGLVSLYDGDQKRQSSPSKQLPHMRTSMGTPAFAPNRHNVSSYGRTLQQELEKSTYKPWIDPTKQQMPKIQETPRYSQAPGSADKSGKYKGFYSYPGK